MTLIVIWFRFTPMCRAVFVVVMCVGLRISGFGLGVSSTAAERERDYSMCKSTFMQKGEVSK